MLRFTVKQYLFPIAALIIIILCVLNTKESLSREDKGNDIRDVLPPDAIPAIRDPEFVSAHEAQIHPDEPVIGLSINGDNRAYSVYLLNSHEIANDVVGGKPVAVTW